MRTLRARVTAIAAGGVVLAIIAVGLAVVAGFNRQQLDQLDRELVDRARAARPLAHLPEGIGIGVEAVAPFAQRSLDRGVFVLLRDRRGQLTHALGDVPSPLPDLPDAPGHATVQAADGTRYRRLTARLREPGFGGGGVVQVGADLGQVEARSAGLVRLVVLLGAVAATAVGVAVFAVVRVAVAPLRRLRAVTEAVAATEDLAVQVPADGPEEVAAVAAGLTTMLQRLARSAAEREAALEAARRFAADAGHELRTPLTAMQANLDALVRNPDAPPELRRQVLAEVVEGQRRLTALLDALQALARADAGLVGPSGEVDLAAVAATAVDAARTAQPDVEWAADLPAGPVVVAGHEAGLRSLLDNLLRNVAVHGRGDGPGRARVTVTAADGRAVVHVDDAGPGVPPAERHRILGRFQRGADAAGRAGSGLGLALVAQLAALHGGSVEVGDSPLGGARFTVTLPLAAAPARPPAVTAPGPPGPGR